MAWKFNGTEIASPDYPLKGNYNNLDSADSTRLENGKIYIKRIRTGVSTLDLQWTNLTTAQAKKILDVINNPSIIFFTAEYPDPTGTKTKTFYAADTTYEQCGQDAWNITTSLVEQ